MVIVHIAAGMFIGPHTPRFSLVSHLEVVRTSLPRLKSSGYSVVSLEYPIAMLRSGGKKAGITAMTQAVPDFRYTTGQAKLF